MSAKLISKTISTPKAFTDDEFQYTTSYAEPEDLKSLQLPFPAKLYNLLETADKSIIDWLPTGLAFKVHDMSRFTNEVLPKYFNQSKFGSFQRQLNVYGFKRLLRGYGDGSYFNDNFQRGRFDLLAKVKRSTAIKAEGDVSPKSKNVSGKSAAVETESSHDFFESFGSFDDFELPPPATETASMSAKRKRLPSISLPEDAEVRQYDLTCTDNDTNSSKSSLTGSLQHAHNLTLEGIIEISLDPFILAEHGEYLYTPYDGSNQIRIKVNTPTPVSTNQRFFADELDEKVDKEFLNGSTLMTENVVQNKDEDGNLLDFLLDFN